VIVICDEFAEVVICLLVGGFALKISTAR